MTDRDPNRRSETHTDVVRLAAEKLRQIATDNGVEAGLLAQLVTEEINKKPLLEEPIVLVAPENDRQSLSQEKERLVSSNPIDLYLIAATGPKDFQPVSVSVIAYGKQLGVGGATDFTEFNTQGREGFRTFSSLFGVQHLNLNRGESFYRRSNIGFLDGINETDKYPPALMVTQRGTGIIVCSVRNLNEGAYSRLVGKDSRTNRPYFDYRAFSFDQSKLTELADQNIAWEISLGRMPQVRDLPTSDTVDKDQVLSFQDLYGFNPESDVRSAIFKDSGDITHLLGLGLISVQTGQPIFIEQAWSLEEKAVFVQMLQECLTKSGDKRLISWSSEPIASFGCRLDIIFKKPGESMIEPMDKDWVRYRTVSEKGSQLTGGEASYVEAVSTIMLNANTWEEITDKLAELSKKSETLLNEISKDSLTLREGKIRDLIADRSKRLSWVRDQFQSPAESVEQEFVDWVYPPNSDTPNSVASLPDSYYAAFKKGEFYGSYLMTDRVSQQTGFLLTFLYNNFPDGIRGFRHTDGIQPMVARILSDNYVRDTGSGIEINIKGLITILRLSLAFETALKGNDNLPDRDLERIFEQTYGQSNVVAAFQQVVSNTDRKSSYPRRSVLHKKKAFGGFELSEQAGELIKKHFPEETDPSSAEYLTKWINFLTEYKNIKNIPKN